jgi:hypothetical protein
VSLSGQTLSNHQNIFFDESIGVDVMRHYRIYSLTGDGHINAPPMTADCETDEAAIARAKAIGNGCDVEVWQERRRVAVLKGKAHEEASGASRAPQRTASA